jgi:hypothetical protein
VGALTRFGLAVLVAAAGAVAAVLLLGRSESRPAFAPTAPLTVRARFSRATVDFGDRVVARVVVLLDRTAVSPGTLELTASVAPLTQLAATRTTRTTRGDLAIVTYEVPAVCIVDGCIAPSGDRPLRLPRVTATVASRSGGVARVAAPWPVLHVHGRVSAADLVGRPRFRGDTSPAAPSYRVAPSTLAALLDGLAVLLVLGGGAIAASEARRLVRRRRRGHAVAGGELERALRLAREAESRPSPDRRRALGLLARLLDRRDNRLAGRASGLAWAKPQPEPEKISGLVEEIEHEVQS